MGFLKAPMFFLVILSLTICSTMSATNKAFFVVITMAGPNRGGYWPSWSANELPPANIETSFFTHVYYAFLSPNEAAFELTVDNPALLTDFTTALHRKNPPVKTLLSIGGASQDASAIFPRMASAQDSRDRFIRSTIQVAREFNFDGLDFDWELPQTQPDMENFGLLLDEWRAAVNEEAELTCKPRLLLSAATYYKQVIPYDVVHSYPVESINRNLDWINAMCYDYHGSWDVTPTGTLAALYDPNGDISTRDGLQSWMDAGLQQEKLVMGLPLYGRTWELQDPAVYGIGAPAVGLGPGDEGAMAYSEVQELNAQKNAMVVFDEPTVSYYSVAGTSWISYDDVKSIERKIQYADALDIGGYFFWAVNGDQDWRISRLASETWN
ncbi:class V chitinase CHIT5a-like [Bidens hawaiensis]|uniref:class V chitinase CHIT5a-like n=1 Tax=Bidens hawaiensis TaxID=980011 RepID=UPI0040490D5D